MSDQLDAAIAAAGQAQPLAPAFAVEFRLDSGRVLPLQLPADLDDAEVADLAQEILGNYRRACRQYRESRQPRSRILVPA